MWDKVFDDPFIHRIINGVSSSVILSTSALGLFSSPMTNIVIDYIKSALFMTLGIIGALGHYIVNRKAYHDFFSGIFKKKDK